MILCLGTTPATQRVMVFKRLAVDAVAVRVHEPVVGKIRRAAQNCHAVREQFQREEQVRLAASVGADQDIQVARFPAHVAQRP